MLAMRRPLRGNGGGVWVFRLVNRDGLLKVDLGCISNFNQYILARRNRTTIVSFWIFVFESMGVLPICMSVYHMCAVPLKAR